MRYLTEILEAKVMTTMMYRSISAVTDLIPSSYVKGYLILMIRKKMLTSSKLSVILNARMTFNSILKPKSSSFLHDDTLNLVVPTC